MHIVAQYFIEHIAEMAAFGAVAVVVITAVPHGAHGPREEVARLFDLQPDFG